MVLERLSLLDGPSERPGRRYVAYSGKEAPSISPQDWRIRFLPFRAWFNEKNPVVTRPVCALVGTVGPWVEVSTSQRRCVPKQQRANKV
jgi:hypothetical protein